MRELRSLWTTHKALILFYLLVEIRAKWERANGDEIILYYMFFFLYVDYFVFLYLFLFFYIFYLFFLSVVFVNFLFLSFISDMRGESEVLYAVVIQIYYVRVQYLSLFVNASHLPLAKPSHT